MLFFFKKSYIFIVNSKIVKILKAYCSSKFSFNEDFNVWDLQTWIKHQSSARILTFFHTSFLHHCSRLVCCTVVCGTWIFKLSCSILSFFQRFQCCKCLLSFYMIVSPDCLGMHSLHMRLAGFFFQLMTVLLTLCNQVL